MNNKKFTFNINTWLPIIIFVLILVLFTVITGGTIVNARNLVDIFNQSIATLIAALGMLFVAAMGSTDITAGVIVGLAGVFGLFGAMYSGFSPLFIIISIGIGAGSGLLLGFVNAKLKVNSFMASLALLIAYRAVVKLVLSNNSAIVPDDIKFLDNEVVKLIILVAIIAVVIYLWKFTRLGNYIRGIGENETAMRHAGVNVDRVKIIAFIISGVLAAIASIFLIVRVGGSNSTMGTGFEMKLMIAIYIAGIPVQGGEGSRVYKVIFGAPTIVILEKGLVLCGLDTNVTQMIKGLVLLGAVCLTSQLAIRMRYVGQKAAKNQGQEEALEAE